MEPLCLAPSKDAIGPVLCVVKAVLFTVIAVFVMYLPLGDPYAHCTEMLGAPQNSKLAMCCLCDIYLFALQAVSQLLKTTNYLLCVILEFLYEAKLRIYALLEKYDGNDLCAICRTEQKNSKEVKKETRQRCKCSRSKCSKTSL